MAGCWRSSSASASTTPCGRAEDAVFAAASPLRVAILATNNDRSYAGGRYHSLILAYALARQGASVRYLTNREPLFRADLDLLCPGAVAFEFWQGTLPEPAPEDPLDWTLVTPTGVFAPDFYAGAIHYAEASRSRLAFINFESANWFNAVAPEPRNPALWDGWQRLCEEDALCLSSSATSQEWAEAFYASPEGRVRFEVCPPPINTVAAARGVELGPAPDGDGSVVAFVRTADGHKGGSDLLAVSSEALQGRTLHVLTGGHADPAFEFALRERLRGTDVRVHGAVSDAAKFGLLSGAKALIFPSRFEGYGYPPVEAAYAGAEVAAYDLPVLRETIGGIGHFAAHASVPALEEALGAALAAPPRRPALRAAVQDAADVDQGGRRLADVLERSAHALEPRAPRGLRVLYGPWRGDAAEARTSRPGKTPPAFPAFVAEACLTEAGDVVVDARAASVSTPTGLLSATPTLRPRSLFIEPVGLAGGQTVWRLLFRLPRHALRERIALSLHGAEGPLQQLFVQIDRARDLRASPLRAVRCDGTPADCDVTFEAVQADRDARFVLLTVAGATGEATPADGTVRFPALSGAPETVYRIDDGVLTGVFGGPALSPLVRPIGAAEANEPSPADLLRVADVTNETWLNGIARLPQDGSAGRVLVRPTIAPPNRGDVLRLPDGSQTHVLSVEDVPQGELTLGLDRWFDPTERPDWFAVVGAGDARRPAPPPSQAPSQAPSSAPWPPAGTIDGYVGPLEDRAAPEVTARFAIGEARFGLYAEKPTVKRQGPVPPEEHFSAEPKRRRTEIVLHGQEGKTALTEGALVVVGDKVARRVTATGRGLRRVATLDEPVPPRLGPRASMRLAVSVDKPVSRHLYPSEVRAAAPRWLLAALDAERPAPPAVPPADERPRVLFASLVPFWPANQGNRIVTYNAICHLLRCGFDVDVVLVGEVPAEETARLFGDRVRVFQTPFPDWEASRTAALRRAVSQSTEGFADHEAGIADALGAAARRFHPYFIVPDEAVAAAKTLAQQNAYSSLVCNYTSMVRIAEELGAVGHALPTTVLTHDALSRLPTTLGGRPADTAYRYCDADTERDVLNAVPGAHVLAISESEQDYFAAIGVTNPIHLCEYDAFEECRGFQVTPDAFESRALVFHASANPINVASLDWFVGACWPEVRRRVPNATLIVIGRICEAWSPTSDGIVMKGEMSRSALMRTLRQASVAINPSLSGTGLKIKTVEAACLGLPSVGLPAAVEGLERDAPAFMRVAKDAEGFARACVSLLSEERAWTRLHRSALALTAERFCEAAIYRAVDEAMGWDRHREARLNAPRPAYDDVPSRTDEPARKALAASARLRHMDHPAAALGYAARAVEAWPTETDGYAAAVAACLAAGSPFEGGAALNAGALARPLSDRLRREVAREGLSPVSALLRETPRHALMTGRPFLPGVHAFGGPLGAGFSYAEPWGAWTDGPFARLVLVLNEPLARQHDVTLTVHAGPGGPPGPQGAGVWINGRFAGAFEVARSYEPTEWRCGNALAAGASVMDLRFYVDHPAPPLGEDGSISDERLLGIGLREVRATPSA